MVSFDNFDSLQGSHSLFYYPSKLCGELIVEDFLKCLGRLMQCILNHDVSSIGVNAQSTWFFVLGGVKATCTGITCGSMLESTNISVRDPLI